MAIGVIKEFRCRAHGDFEGTEPECPHGCTGTVDRVFLTPAAFRSNRTTRIDQRVENLAKAHNLTDISNRGGRAAIREKPGAQRDRDEVAKMIRERYGDKPWGSIPKGGPAAAVAQYHGTPDNVLGEVKPHLTHKPVHRIQDPQKLALTPDMVKNA